jgi:DNA-binding winged helix-turn-helix (wHTH) protein
MAEAYWQIGEAQLYEDSRRLVGPLGTKFLRPQQYDVLEALLKNKGSTTTNEHLQQLLWNRCEKDDQHRLHSLVSEIRKLLGDQHEIRTIYRKGYAWMGLAERIEAAADRNPAELHQTGVGAQELRKPLLVADDYGSPGICITICITSRAGGDLISQQLMEEILKRCLNTR